MRLSSFKVGGGTRPTVLLHGFLGSGRNLRTLAQRWSERAPDRGFLLPDLRGHGDSPPPTGTTDLTEMGRDVLETARAEGLVGPLDLVGHSLGGRVALAASLAEPEAVRSVVLLDISPSPVEGERMESGQVLEVLVRAPASAKDRRELREWLVTHGVRGPTADWLLMNVVHEGDVYRWKIDREALRRLHPRVNAEDLWAAVERPGARVRCIRGGRSPYVGDADVSRMVRAGCRVDTLEEAGHYLHVDALDALVDLLAVTEASGG